jgi:hypothetical protein
MPQRAIDVNTRKIYWNIRRELKNKPKTKEVLDAIKLLGFNNFKGFIKESNELAAKNIIENPFGVKLTEGAGTIAIKKRFSSKHINIRSLDAGYYYTKSNIDWGKTKKTGTVQYFYNDHSSNFRFKIHWKKTATSHFYLNVYFLKMERKWRQLLANNIVAGKKDYLTYKR